MAGRKEIEAAVGARKAHGRTEHSSEVVLQLKAVTTDAISNVDLVLRRGQIVGLAGLVGSGRTEIARAIVGADRVRSRKFAPRRIRGVVRFAATGPTGGSGHDERGASGRAIRRSQRSRQRDGVHVRSLLDAWRGQSTHGPGRRTRHRRTV